MTGRVGFETFVLICAGLAAETAVATPALDNLARDVERAESIRDVKTLQRTYAQYAQFGLWSDMAVLFAKEGVFDTDAGKASGPKAIEHLLMKQALLKQWGNGRQGLANGAVNTVLIAAPVINLSVDGQTAKGRWDSFMLLSDAKGNASVAGGVFENDYIREQGRWKIAHLHFYPQYVGAYETGWSNVGGADLSIVPYHFNGDSAGMPIPAPVGPPPQTRASLGELEERIRVMNDEDQVRNLQAAYNYYVDRKMWDDVGDLFAANSVVEIGGVGVYDGPKGAHRAMERMGAAGLQHGQLNDHLLFDDVAQVLPGGHEARMRGFELGLVGDADTGEAHWEVNVYDNRFIKEDGLWKIREMRLFPLVRSDYHEGWGKSHLSEPVPSGALAPDHPVPSADQGSPFTVIPAFHMPNPATRRKVQLPSGKRFVALTDLTAATPTTSLATTSPATTSPATTSLSTTSLSTTSLSTTSLSTTSLSTTSPGAPSSNENQRLAQAVRRLAVSTAYDGAENLNSAYGEFVDDYQWTDMAKLFGQHGAKQVPFVGYYAGADRITQAMLLEYGETLNEGRPSIAIHWLIQPVINVASDGRSSTARSYLFHPDTSRSPASAALFGAMYPNNQFVLEDGVWRIWNLSLDEPYFSMPAGWTGGWSSKASSRTAAPPRFPAKRDGQPHYFGKDLVAKYAPDVPITVLGARQEHFRGGTGETWEWPQILPMWWSYRNPVSGRTPDNFLSDCVPCEYSPDLSMTRHGYLLPPTGPEIH